MKNQLLLLLVLVCAINSSLAQRMTKKPVSFSYYIEPLTEFPAELEVYTSKLETPLNPYTWWTQPTFSEIEDYDEKKIALAKAIESKKETLASQYLKIDLARLAPSKATGNFSIELETSQVDVSYVNIANIGVLEPDEIVFRYAYSAKVIIKKEDGTVIFEQWVHENEADQKITKADLMLNLTLKTKLDLYKNNPEKQAKVIQKKLDNREADILEEALQRANAAINNEYGRKYVTSGYSIFSVKGKEFSELEDTRSELFKAFMSFNSLSKKKRWTKSQVDEVMKSSLVVWEKYLAGSVDQMEEQAVKGLNLNCTMAYTWLGDYEKAKTYLDKVPEAYQFEEQEEEDENNPPPPTGPGTILDFATYARNMKQFYETFSEIAPERITFKQGF